jgi:cytoskeletal protein CcmA (bactofilin family)
MAIFEKINEKAGSIAGATIIAECAKIVGEIEIDCNLHIDGVFNGTIKSTNVVTIGKTGYVKGKIFAKELIINGLFEGEVDSNAVEILQNGKLNGIVISEEFIIEKSGIFQGESKQKNSESNYMDIKLDNDKKKISHKKVETKK